MTRIRALMAYTTLLCVLLCGCAQLSSRSYLSVSEHNDPYAVKETQMTDPQSEEDPVKKASNYYSMRTILRGFIREGVEHGQLLLADYDGEVEEDLRKVTEYFTVTDPVGAYAIDYMSYEKIRSNGDWLITLDTVYRRSVNEIQSIRSVRGNEKAHELIYNAMAQFDASVTLQISGYQEEDFGQTIYSYCLNHPETVVMQPETAVAIYPETGNVRIVELHFSYGQSKDDLRNMLTGVTTIFSSAAGYIRSEADDTIKAGMLYAYLMGRFSYTQAEEKASVYSLLCEGVADSTTFASVFAYLCKRSGIECILVEGTKQQQSWTWNIVRLSGIYYHVDLMSSALSKEPRLTPLTDVAMTAYTWDTEAYPICNGQPAMPEE